MIRIFQYSLEEGREHRRLMKELNEENRRYYKKFFLALHREAASIYKNPRAVSILPDIIEAQKSGLSASEYFGLPAEKLALEMVKELPNQKFLEGKFIWILAWFFGIFSGMIIMKLAHLSKISDLQLFLMGFVIFISFPLNILVQAVIERFLINKSFVTRSIISSLLSFIIVGSVMILTLTLIYQIAPF